MKEKCKRRPLDSNTVRIEIAPATTAILVSGLQPSASHELVELYFESPRSRGGAVTSEVHFTDENGQAVVVFENFEGNMHRCI